MAKDIEGLAKIGEELLLQRLNLSVFVLDQRLDDVGNSQISWKDNFRNGIYIYRKIRNHATSLGLDVSEYDKKILALTELYSKITGEMKFIIDRIETGATA
jgi:hypothetical protein